MKVIIEGIKGIQKVYITTFYNHLKSILPVGFILRGRFQYPTGVRRVTDPGSNGLAQLYTPAAQWSRNAWDAGDEPRGELALNFTTFTNFTISLSFPTSVSSHQQVQGGIAGRLTPPQRPLVH